MLPSLQKLSLNPDAEPTGPKYQPEDGNPDKRDSPYARPGARPTAPSPFPDGLRMRGREKIIGPLVNKNFRTHDRTVYSVVNGLLYRRSSPSDSTIEQKIKRISQFAYTHTLVANCGRSNCFFKPADLSAAELGILLFGVAMFANNDIAPTSPASAAPVSGLTLRHCSKDGLEPSGDLQKDKRATQLAVSELLLTISAARHRFAPNIVAVFPVHHVMFDADQRSTAKSFAYIFEAGWTSMRVGLRTIVNDFVEASALGASLVAVIMSASSHGFLLGNIKGGNVVCRRVANAPSPTFEVKLIDFDEQFVARGGEALHKSEITIALMNFMLMANELISSNIGERDSNNPRAETDFGRAHPIAELIVFLSILRAIDITVETLKQMIKPDDLYTELRELTSASEIDRNFQLRGTNTGMNRLEMASNLFWQRLHYYYDEVRLGWLDSRYWSFGDALIDNVHGELLEFGRIVQRKMVEALQMASMDAIQLPYQLADDDASDGDYDYDDDDEDDEDDDDEDDDEDDEDDDDEDVEDFFPVRVPSSPDSWQLPDDFGLPPLTPAREGSTWPPGQMENDNVRAILASVDSNPNSPPRLQSEGDVESLSDQLADFLQGLTEEDMEPARDFLLPAGSPND
jgi:hypothetical protein